MTTLRPIDFDSVTWKRLAETVNARIDELRKLNDRPQDADKTALIRGGIAELKKILALSTDSAKQGGNPIPDFDE